MKTYFEKPEVRVISFSVEDTITSSSNLDEDELPIVTMPNVN